MLANTDDGALCWEQGLVQGGHEGVSASWTSRRLYCFLDFRFPPRLRRQFRAPRSIESMKRSNFAVTDIVACFKCHVVICVFVFTSRM